MGASPMKARIQFSKTPPGRETTRRPAHHRRGPALPARPDRSRRRTPGGETSRLQSPLGVSGKSRVGRHRTKGPRSASRPSGRTKMRGPHAAAAGCGAAQPWLERRCGMSRRTWPCSASKGSTKRTHPITKWPFISPDQYVARPTSEPPAKIHMGWTGPCDDNTIGQTSILRR